MYMAVASSQADRVLALPLLRQPKLAHAHFEYMWIAKSYIHIKTSLEPKLSTGSKSRTEVDARQNPKWKFWIQVYIKTSKPSHLGKQLPTVIVKFRWEKAKAT